MLHVFASLSMLQPSPTIVPLDRLDIAPMSTGWGSPHRDLSVDNHPLKIGGRDFAHGVGTHANSEITVRVGRGAIRFHSWVGVDDEAGKRGSVRFEVFVDGKMRGDSGVLRGGDAAKELNVDLVGAKTVRLVVDDGGDGIDFDHADWADARFETKAPSVHLSTMGAVNEPAMAIAHVDLKEVAIHGARVVGCTPDHEFIFRIPATGRGLHFSAAGLPRGIHLDQTTGVLRGRAPAAGKYAVHLKVSGRGGQDSRTLTIISGEHRLAQTPPMGWNSWNVWGTSVNANKVRAAADSFIKSHLADFGYTYVNIDDAWEDNKRADDGQIVPNQKFGDMAELAQYVHSKGLKLGIYSSPGPKTCAGYEASYKHEVQDARTYASWGVDYLKYDWCSFGNVPHPDGLPGFQLPYLVMRDALDQAPRDIVFSLCQYGMGDVYKWGHSVTGGNLWRTTGDINDSWQSMSGIGFSHSERSKYVKPGGWNDPDMLVVGRLGWGDNPRQTHLTGNEQITHISLWSMLAAPLIIGCDLTKLDGFTRDVLMNPDVLEVDQDPLGSAATRRFKDGDVEIWARPLWDGSYAIGLFNRGIEAAPVHTVWKRDIGVSKPMDVRNLWMREDLGRERSGFTAKVPAHGTVLIRVTPLR